MENRKETSLLVRGMRAALALLFVVTGVQVGVLKVQAEPRPAVQLVIGSASATSGQTVEVPVSVVQPAGSAGIASYGIQIDFDPASLEVIDVEIGYGSRNEAECPSAAQGCFQSHFDNANGWIRAIWVDTSGGDRPITADQRLFVLKVRAKSASTAGVKPFTVDSSDPAKLSFTDGDMNSLAVEMVSGKVTVSRPSSSSGSAPGAGPNSQTPTGSEATIIVNGKAENAGTVISSGRGGQSVTTISVDENKLAAKLESEGSGAVVTVPVGTGTDIVVGELNGRMVKRMEDKQAVLEIKTDRATYTLPALQMNIGAISEQIGKSVALEDIKVRIEIAAASATVAKVVENAANKGSFTLVSPPLEFKVQAVYGNRTIEVTKFNAYVERTIAIPGGVDPSKITTGVVVDQDGTVRHVPTKVVVIDGKHYAKINSLTNSTYSVVWHPLEFADVAQHWAKDAVNDMGSRMVIGGVGNRQFDPDRDITRAEFAAIVVRGLGLKPEEGAASFSDVKASDWYNGAVKTAHAYGLVGGMGDGTFRPNDKITREQAMKIVADAMKLTALKNELNSIQTSEQALQPFKDRSSAASWARSGIADSVRAGVVTGRNATTLAPKAYITRAETAAIVQRLLQKSGLI
ncbi:S-layer homology domain-containing protein [Cohnella phaseoli]|uniref:S-layer family protein n=1 Tax=Cohnella phaseoli TaxID=456490 RepID=A0A3D9KCW2_9BACL|nr:S-layer homology domain-containing protein [Cohnella phaseoli]RED84238.1 S-layer family protein [Cohnella phaseoli]